MARYWLELAEDKGETIDQSIIEDMFNAGELYSKKEFCYEAVDWYQMAALKGHIEAQKRLSHIYENGLCGRNKDPYLADILRKKAANGGKDVKRLEHKVPIFVLLCLFVLLCMLYSPTKRQDIPSKK